MPSKQEPSPQMSFATVTTTALPSERRWGLLWMVPLPIVVLPTRRVPHRVRRLDAKSSAALAVFSFTRQTVGWLMIESPVLLPSRVRLPALSSA